MSFSTTISQLRKDAGLSQQEVADGISIAKATYVKIEKGDREPKLDEIRSISKFYEVDTVSLIDGVHKTYEPVVVYEFDEEEIIPREIDPTTKPEKLREVLLYVLGKVGARPNVGQTVLYKLLYFIDFDYYEKTGRSITGLTYIHNHYGPTPKLSDFDGVVAAMEDRGEIELVETRYFKNTQKKLLPNAKAELVALSGAEIKHIDEELARLGDKTAKELTELSHYDTPWLVAKQGAPIDYRGVFYRTGLTSVVEPEDDL